VTKRFHVDAHMVSVVLRRKPLWGFGAHWLRRPKRPLPYFIFAFYDAGPGVSPIWTWQRGRGWRAGMPGQDWYADCDWWMKPGSVAYRAWVRLFLHLGPLKGPVGWVWRRVED
jgi:hypothetical protein